jgi:putative transposase
VYHHKNIRLPHTDYLSRQFYFVTICCYRRHPIFTDHSHSSKLVEILRSESATRTFVIHAYCVMPDHFHFLAEGLAPTSDLLNLVLTIKMKSSRSYHQTTSQPVWQKKFFDHILRATDSPEQVARYIWLNPVRKGLCTQPNNYPLAGALTDAIPRLPSSPVPWSPPWKRNTRASKPWWRPPSEAGAFPLPPHGAVAGSNSAGLRTPPPHNSPSDRLNF